LKYWQALKELKEVLNAISKRVALKPSKFYNFEHPRLLGILNPKVGIHVESCIFSFWVWVVLSLPLPSLTSFQPTSFTHSSFISSIFLISSIWFNSIHHVYPVMIHMINFIHMDSSCFMMSPSLAIWVGIQPQHTYEISPCHHFSSMLKVFIYAFNHSSWMV
jgi:hypothetical protein